MKTTLLLLTITISGMICAQTPVIDWEEAPDKMKIKTNDQCEYAEMAAKINTSNAPQKSRMLQRNLIANDSQKVAASKKRRIYNAPIKRN